MLYVIFTMNGKTFRTSAEYWIKYGIFDAVDEKGNSEVVNKDNCILVDTEEI